MPHCWKLHVVAHIFSLTLSMLGNFSCFGLWTFFSKLTFEERSGSKVVCLTRDQGVVGSSLIVGAALCP